MNNEHRKTKNGFGLVEILIAIFIISASLIYIFSAIVQLTKASGGAYLSYQANLINESNLEIIKALRDSSWTDNIVPLTEGVPYYAQVQGGIASLTQNNPGLIYQNFQSSLVVGPVYRDGNGNIAPAGTLDVNIKKITSATSWNYRGENRSLQMISYLGNIFGN